MDWIIEQRDGMWVLVCGQIIDSRWHSEASAQARLDQLNAGREQMAELVAAAGAPPEGRPFYSVLCVDEYEAADGRYFEHFEWETVPLSLWTLDDQGMGGHMGAEASGSIRTIERLSDGRRIFATGFLGTTEEGLQTEQQIEQQMLRFVSVDPADYDADWEITKIGTDGWPIEDRLRFTNYVIGGATVLGSPAIRLAVIWLEGMDAPVEFTEPLPEPVAAVQVPEIVDVSEDQDIIVIMASAAERRAEAIGESLDQQAIPAGDVETRTLLASARAARSAACVLTRECGGPALPPADWFEQPKLSGPTPLTVTPEGRIYGHIALWDVPHRGFLHYEWSERIYAPRSRTSYRQFLLHPLAVSCCADDACGHERKSVMTGTLTFGTTHAGKRLSAAAAQRFYEDSGLQGADVAIWDDQWGPCVSGALRPGMDDARVREVLGSTPSGDWRRIDGGLELCAVLGVNCGGIPVLASAHVEDGETMTLIAGWPQAIEPPAESLVASVLASRIGPRPSEQRASRAGGITQELVLDTDRAVAAITEVLDRRLGPIERDLAMLRPAIAEQLAEDIEHDLHPPDPVEVALAAVRS